MNAVTLQTLRMHTTTCINEDEILTSHNAPLLKLLIIHQANRNYGRI